MEGILVVIGILSVCIIIEMLKTKTIWNRLLNLNQLSAKITVSMVIYSVATKQQYLLDVAIAYTILSFLSVVLIARFIRERGTI